MSRHNFSEVLTQVVRQAVAEARLSSSSIRLKGKYCYHWRGECTDEMEDCDFDIQVTPDGVSPGPNMPWPGWEGRIG